MTRPAPDAVKTVACIGTGTIGAGWAAHFLARGYRVTLWDPAPDFEARAAQVIDTAWPSLEALGLADGASRDNAAMAKSLEAAVADAGFVKESAPERLDIKRALLADIDRVTPPGIVIASSTSGFAMTEMAVDCATPERLVVGHPFNPPYLIPIVEVVPGEKTHPDVIAWTVDFYRAAGKHPLRLDNELPGFLANRLQEAVWREALHMVAAGEATVEQIDAAIVQGPGLRWAMMGPFMTYHLGGGPGGMAYCFDHFGPTWEAPWTRLDAPPLTDALRDASVLGCADLQGDAGFAELARARDDRLVGILKALRAADAADGSVL